MIKNIFDLKFIKGDELTFYVYISIIILMIIVTFIIGYKEIKKHETK